MQKYKCLTKDEQLEIKYLRKKQVPPEQIASRLGISMSIISRNTIYLPADDGFTRYLISNRCTHRGNCNKRYQCYDKPNCLNCSQCGLCNEICNDFIEEACSFIHDSPYCCDGCDAGYNCLSRKKFYLHKEICEAWLENLAGAKTGTSIIADDAPESGKFFIGKGW